MADRTSFAKLQRDRKKKAKAALKRDKRQGDETTPEATPTYIDPDMTKSARLLAKTEGHREISPDMLLSMVEALQSEYDTGTIDEDEYEARKNELLSRVQ